MWQSLKKGFSLLFLLFAISGTARAANAYYFEYNERCKSAYEAMISLRIHEAQQLLQQELKEHPQNLIPVMIANYEDCLVLLFNGDAAEYKKRKNNFDQRLALIEQGDSHSPWYRYSKAVLYFQWAAIRIRFEENFQAGVEFRKSFLYLKENRKRFPSFKYNQLLFGLEQAIVGTVPEKYKWVANMLGLKGNVKSGTAQVVNFLNTRDGSTAQMRQEAVLYYCYLKFYLLSERETVWKYLDASNLDLKNNHLFVYLKASLALNDNKAELAEQVLSSRTGGPDYLEVPILNYMMGNALLFKLDEDCIVYFQRFLSKNRGRIYIKDAFQKMSLYYYATENQERADHYKNKILKSGSTLTDADKQAQRFALNSIVPDPNLLKARLYSDGGYFNKALEVFATMHEEDYTADADRLEYRYRYGKIYQLTGQDAKAIPLLEAAVRLGADRPEQFGARAALELGQIYEDRGQRSKAIDYYRQCLNMKDHDFESSLEQKAKAGINRLGGN